MILPAPNFRRSSLSLLTLESKICKTKKARWAKRITQHRRAKELNSCSPEYSMAPPVSPPCGIATKQTSTARLALSLSFCEKSVVKWHQSHPPIGCLQGKGEIAKQRFFHKPAIGGSFSFPAWQGMAIPLSPIAYTIQTTCHLCSELLKVPNALTGRSFWFPFADYYFTCPSSVCHPRTKNLSLAVGSGVRKRWA